MRLLGPTLVALVSVGVLVLAMSAGARAQEASLAFEDASLDAFPPPANGWADVVAGELVIADEGTFRASITLTLLPEMQPGIAYGFLFSDGERDWYAAAVTIPTLTYFFGLWGDGAPAGSRETVGTVTLGPQGVVTIDVPLRALGNATVLSHPRGGTMDIKSGAFPLPLPIPYVWLDEAEGAGELVLPREPDPSAREPDPNAPEPELGSAAPAEEGVARAAEAPSAAQDDSLTVPGPGLLWFGAAVALVLLADRLSRRTL